MFKTIIANYPGTCKRCNGPIQKGDRIRYGGYGRTYHFASDCAQTPASEPTTEPVRTVNAELVDVARAAVGRMAGRF